MATPESTSDDAPVWWSEGAAPAGRRRDWRTAIALGLLVAIAVVAVAVVSAVNRAAPTTYRVTSGSMEPTIAIGQVVRVDRSAYASSSPRVGDIVAFRAPVGALGEYPVCGVVRTSSEVCPVATAAESGAVYIKRIVAGPGDTISVINGGVIRNGAAERLPAIAPCTDDAVCSFPTAVRLAPNAWFVMGDNRGWSDDSRYWGPIPRSWIVGKVVT